MSLSKPFVDALSLENYRCLPDGRIGPLGRFTVISGRNGSGKSSLIEALQLCLCHSSYRIPEGDCSTVTARSPIMGSTLKLWRDGSMVSDFDESNGQKTRTQLLEDLYGITAHGQKARYLLPQLFSTHNLLTAERIVSFLEAKESGELHSALEELILGREALDTWSYIEQARVACARIIQALDTQSSKSRNTTSGLKADLQRLSEHDSNVILSLVDEAKQHIPSDIWGEPPADLIGESGQLWAREVESKLSQLVQRTEQLQMESLGGDLPETWAHIPAFLQNNKKSCDQLNQSIHEEQRAAADAEEKRKEGKGHILSYSESVQELQDDLQRREVVGKVCKQFVSWLPEIGASHSSKTLKHEIQLIEHSIVTVRNVAKQASDLAQEPGLGQLQKGIEKSVEEQKTVREKLYATADLLSKAKSAHEDLQDSLKACNSNNSTIDQSVGQLSAALEAYLSLVPSAECPACGNAWPDKAALNTAIETHRKALLSSSSPIAKEMVRLSQETEKKRQELSRLTKSHNSIQTQLNEITATLVQRQGRADSLKREYDLVLQRVSDLDSIELDEATRSPSQIVQVLNERASELIASSAKKTRILDALWAGLRREAFEAQMEAIESQREEIHNLLAEIQKATPDGYDSTAWAMLIEDLVKSAAGARKKLSEARDALKTAKSTDEQLTIKLAQYRKDIEDKEAQLKKALYSASLLEKLRKTADRLLSAGFIESQDAINFSAATEKIGDVIRIMEKVCAEIRAETERLEQRNFLTVRLEKEITSFFELDQQLKRAHNLQGKLQAVRSIHDYERDSWQAYEKTAAAIFGRLHWPEDFKSIEFQKQGSATPELCVRLATNNVTVAASTRLSAGQRAALAVSTFWALNMTPKRIPPLIVMDEPIQNIDDMNTLNFLDGLRGLVEQGGRQILLTTASERLRGLLRRKFSYLGSEYVEINLTRDSAEACSVVTRTDAEKPEYKLRRVSA